ncbi:UTP--glucose-1-phosphate uridylyltransferase GalU [Marinospirillum insulare]|uniref:UTP--glucose-1-phosphate uridylyltransferase n=1 Tax=Marinospirillum insulare TaxID=217169 RepID=A0ABQ5ZY91_9GAMM|nr:UTP--glucose-1-phosphate uridylyltransferase GalU [Marinospirillum insulare]GLR62849.1 UTP--glucose-1-phosphate uridylyltransferase [Marinospirillum insulare]
MIRKAVLPVAGLGTRFLPASKAIPKEMLTLVDKPVIQQVVEEAIAAGITEIVLVTHSAKKAIEDHFDVNYELENELEKRGKTELLNELRSILPEGIRVVSVRQGRALGLGHAILCAREVIGDEPFAVLLPDVLVDNYHQPQTDLACMNKRFEDIGLAQILVDAVPKDKVDQYGIVALNTGTELAAGESKPMQAMVEKPAIDQAPSNLAIVGRYVLPARIFELLAETQPGAGNEIQLTDALDALLQESGAEAYRMQGETYDCGSKLGYLHATLVHALRHPEVKQGFRELINNLPEA